MKRIFSGVVLFLAVAMLAASCSEEEQVVADRNVVGAWKAPLSVGGGAVPGVGGKNLVINENHTASFANLSFNYWKIEGDELIFTHHVDHGVVREVDVLRYIIATYCDTVMTLVGTYTRTIGDSVYLRADMSGMYQKQTEDPQPQL